MIRIATILSIGLLLATIAPASTYSVFVLPLNPWTAQFSPTGNGVTEVFITPSDQYVTGFIVTATTTDGTVLTRTVAVDQTRMSTVVAFATSNIDPATVIVQDVY